MSIIYDALQKTQKNREYLRLQAALVQKKRPPFEVNLLLQGLGLIFLSALSGVLVSYFTLKSEDVFKQEARLKPAAVQALKPQHFWLTKAKEEPSPQVVKSELAPVQVAQKQSAQPSLAIGKLTLNGVLISGLEKIALINNQSFHLGDMIDGMRIVGIETTQVRLQSGNELIELKVPV